MVFPGGILKIFKTQCGTTDQIVCQTETTCAALQVCQLHPSTGTVPIEA